VHEHPETARTSRVLAVPTLIKSRPGPERRLAGDLSQTDNVLLALGIG
jgi:circadian clock protein KaiB